MQINWAVWYNQCYCPKLYPTFDSCIVDGRMSPYPAKNRAHITVWFSVLFFSNRLIIPIPKNLDSGTCLITIYKSLSILYTFQIQRNNYWRNFLPPHYNTLYFLTSWLLTKNCGRVWEETFALLWPIFFLERADWHRLHYFSTMKPQNKDWFM